MTWIKTTDRLPEPGERVLVRSGAYIDIATLDKLATTKFLTTGEQIQCVIKRDKQKYCFSDKNGRPQYTFEFWLPLSVLPHLPEML